MVKLRLTRLGRKKVPFYRIAAMEALTQRDGKAIAYLGTYNPLVEWQYPNERKILMDEYEANTESIGTTDLMKLNYRYSWNKNSKLSPVQVFDNGEKTFIVLKSNLQEMPAFYVKGLDNQLSLVNTKIEGRNVMINNVVKEIYMTLGKNTLKIYNQKK